MRRSLLLLILILAALAQPSYAQSMGATVITQGGNTANVTAGNSLQVDVKSVNGTTVTGMVAGSVPVTIVSGAGSGGTAQADESAFTEGTTNFTPVGCEFTSSSTALTTAHAGGFLCLADRSLNVAVKEWGGTALGAPTNFGTTPGAVIAATVNSSLFLGTAAAATAASGVQKVGIVGNTGAVVDAAFGAAPPANGFALIGLGSGLTGGAMTGVPVSDTPVSKSITTATTTLIITGVASRQVRIGSYEIFTSGADNVEWIEGTGATCGTGTVGMVGGATSGLGLTFSAAGGVATGSGLGTILQTATAGDSVCLVTSAAVNLGLNAQYTIY